MALKEYILSFSTMTYCSYIIIYYVQDLFCNLGIFKVFHIFSFVTYLSLQTNSSDMLFIVLSHWSPILNLQTSSSTYCSLFYFTSPPFRVCKLAQLNMLFIVLFHWSPIQGLQPSSSTYCSLVLHPASANKPLILLLPLSLF